MSFAGLDVWLRSRAAADLFFGVVLIRRGEPGSVLRGVRLGHPGPAPIAEIDRRVR